MARRQPVNLRPVLIVYNFAMVCLSAYMFYEVNTILLEGTIGKDNGEREFRAAKRKSVQDNTTSNDTKTTCLMLFRCYSWDQKSSDVLGDGHRTTGGVLQSLLYLFWVQLYINANRTFHSSEIITVTHFTSQWFQFVAVCSWWILVLACQLS